MKDEITFELERGRCFTICGVLYVPSITKHLLSISQATTNGTSIEFHSDYVITKCKTSSEDMIRICCKHERGVYPIKYTSKSLILEAQKNGPHQVLFSLFSMAFSYGTRAFKCIKIITIQSFSLWLTQQTLPTHLSLQTLPSRKTASISISKT